MLKMSARKPQEIQMSARKPQEAQNERQEAPGGPKWAPGSPGGLSEPKSDIFELLRAVFAVAGGEDPGARKHLSF